MHEIESVEESGSKFFCSILKTQTFEEVQKAYLKIRSEHLNATHVMCGYRIFGAHVPLLQNYSNDGETFCGNRILDALKSAGVFNMTIFVVRYYGGEHMGSRRFEIINEMCREAIASYPGVMDYGQKMWKQ